MKTLDIIILIFLLVLFFLSIFFVNIFTWKDTFYFIILSIPIFYLNYRKNKSAGHEKPEPAIPIAAFFLSIFLCKLLLGIYKCLHIHLAAPVYLSGGIIFLFLFLIIARLDRRLFFTRESLKRCDPWMALLLTFTVFVLVYILIYFYKAHFPEKIVKTQLSLLKIPLILIFLIFFSRFLFRLLTTLSMRRIIVFALSVFLAISFFTTFYKVGLSAFHYKKAIRLERSNKFSDAIGEYSLSLLYNPLYMSPRLRIARIYFDHGDLDKAFNLYGALANDTLDSSFHFFLGQIHEEEKARKEAKSEYGLVDKKSRYHQEAKERLFQLLIEEKRWNEAIGLINIFRNLEDFKKLKFASGEDYLDFGNILYLNGRIPESLYLFQKGAQFLTEKLRLPALYHNLAKEYYELDNFSKARFYFAKALELEPHNLSTLIYLFLMESAPSRKKELLKQEIDNFLSGLPLVIIYSSKGRREARVLSFFECEEGTHETGAVVDDEFSSKNKAVYARSTIDERGRYMVLSGPVWLPAGKYQVYFRLRSVKKTDNGINLCKLEAVAFNDNNVLFEVKSKSIASNEFFKDGTYKDFELEVKNPGNVFLQFRIMFLAGEVFADRIIVVPNTDLIEIPA